MEKDFYLIPQPPLSEKFNFLVDVLAEKSEWGHTSDLKKIDYNRKLLGGDFNQDFNEKMLLATDGLTLIFPIGRYIAIFELRKDGKQGRMTFMDYRINKSREEIKSMLKERFSEGITNEWLKHYDMFQKEFTEQDDVELCEYKPENFLKNLSRNR